MNDVPFLDCLQCCLASIIVVALAGMFRQVKDLVLLWQVSTYDFVSIPVSIVSNNLSQSFSSTF